MLEFGRIVLTRQAEKPFLTKEQTEMLMSEMEGRLADKDDAVRQQAVHDVCDMAFQVLLPSFFTARPLLLFLLFFSKMCVLLILVLFAF
jgi:hypothetical protein